MKTPPEVVEFCNNLIKAVASATGHMLDMTPETLPILDYYCRIYRESLSVKDETGEEKSAGEKSADIALLLAPMTGACFGEVICRKYDCRWAAPTKKYDRWRVQFNHCFLYFNPISIAMEILCRKTVEGWPSAYFTTKEDEDVLCRALDQWDWVREEDYYTFIVRWEILDSIIDTLATIEALRRQKEGRRFKPYSSAVYERHIRTLVEKKRAI